MNKIIKTILKERQLYFDLIINSNCNLNCIGCFRMSPLCDNDPRYYEPEKFEKDLNHLKTLGFEIKNISLNGGEPTLNKNLFKYAEIIEKIYPECDKSIYTNCILLENCSDDFLKKIKKYNLAIVYTNYFLKKINFSKLFNRLDKFKIPYSNCLDLFEKGFKYKTKMFKILKRPENEDKNKSEKNFKECCNNCLSFRDGKFYRCSLCVNIDKLGLNYYSTNNDVIDIYKIKSPEEFYNILDKPLDFCKYCDIDKSSKMVWKKSKKAITEWILE